MSKTYRGRVRLALTTALAALTLGVMAGGASSAQASQFEWCNHLLQPHTWCRSTESSQWYSLHMLSSTVYYSGSGTVSVCEMVREFYERATISSKCGNQFAEATPAEVEPYLGRALESLGENNSSFAHTIKGVLVE